MTEIDPAIRRKALIQTLFIVMAIFGGVTAAVYLPDIILPVLLILCISVIIYSLYKVRLSILIASERTKK